MACLDVSVFNVQYNLQTQANTFVPSHRRTLRIANLCFLSVAGQVRTHGEHTGRSLHPSSPHLYIVSNGLSPHAFVAIAIAIIQRVNKEFDFANLKRCACSYFYDSSRCSVNVIKQVSDAKRRRKVIACMIASRHTRHLQREDSFLCWYPLSLNVSSQNKHKW